MLDLRLFEYFPDVVDMAAGDAVGIKALYPVIAVLVLQAFVDRGEQVGRRDARRCTSGLSR